jgi:hypothetical protein
MFVSSFESEMGVYILNLLQLIQGIPTSSQVGRVRFIPFAFSVMYSIDAVQS